LVRVKGMRQDCIKISNTHPTLGSSFFIAIEYRP